MTAGTAQEWLRNLDLVDLFVIPALTGALGGVVIALIYRLRRAEFITAIAAMALADVVSKIAMPIVYGYSLEMSRVWAPIIIGWPFGIFVLRHKKQMVWNGLLASVIAQIVAFGIIIMMLVLAFN